MKLTAGRARLIRGVLEEVAALASAPVGLISRAAEAIAFLRPAKKRTELKYVAYVSPAEPARRDLVNAVRPIVEARAGGFCECGCGIAFGIGEYTAEWDEFFGRRPEDITVEKTWLLIRMHHRAKGHNDPSREHWDDKFRAHCARHGYPVPRKRFYRIPMRRRVG